MYSAAAKSLQSCPTLCNPIDGSPPGSLVPGILQARTLEWVAIFFSNAWKWKVKSLSRVRLLAPSWTAAYQAPPSTGFSRQEYWSEEKLLSLSFKMEEKRKAVIFKEDWLTSTSIAGLCLVIQLCLTLWDSMDYTVHGILQARILEWVSFLFSRGSSQPRDWTQVSYTAGGFSTSWATREAQESTRILQWIFLTQESNWGLLHCRWILYQLSYEGNPYI